MTRRSFDAAAAASVSLSVAIVFASASAAAADVRLDVRQFRFVQRESGHTNYYSVVDAPAAPYLHAEYTPGLDTAVMGIEVPDSAKHAHHLRWDWRARVLPHESGPCDAHAGVADEAALVYVVWKRGLKWYTLRYIWGAGTTRGGVCNRKRNMFRAEDTIVLEAGPGPAVGEWVHEDLDLDAEFRRHFEGGDANADVPQLTGLALMSDGDQSHSASSADYAEFVFHD